MMRAEKRFRLLRLVFTLLTLALAGLLCLFALQIYLRGAELRRADPSAMIFSPEAVGEKLKLLLPAFGLWLAALAAALAAAPRRREHPRETRPKEPAASAEAPRAVLLRRVLLALALVLIVLGVLNGGLQDVLVKAVNICTECIGLG